MVEPPVDPSLAAKAILRAYLEPVLRHVGWFGFFLVLAPIIGPRGYGLFVLALSGIAIVEAVFAETVTAVLVDLPTVEARHLSTALVTLIAGGAAISLLLYAATGSIAAMVGEAGFADIFRSLSLLPLLGSLAAVPTALLRRQGRQAPSIAASAAGLAAGGGAALALAWAGAGAWSLVAQIIVLRFLECAVLWAVSGERVGLTWSRRHFAELARAVELRAFAPAAAAVNRYAPCLLIGLSLGPTAAGLYLLASRLPEALADIFLARPAFAALTRAAARHCCRIVLPAVLAAALLAIALPPLVDLRWWGAVLPGQILLLGAIPAAVVWLRAGSAENPAAEARWQVLGALGGIAVVALALPYGLTAIAAAQLGWVAAMAAASLWPIKRALGAGWRAALVATSRPCAGAAACGVLLAAFAEPVGLALDAVPALCLLTASGWLCYLVIRGEPYGTRPALPIQLRPAVAPLSTARGDASG